MMGFVLALIVEALTGMGTVGVFSFFFGEANVSDDFYDIDFF